MNNRLFLLVAAVGLSTYLMRLIPLGLTSRRMSTQGALPPRLRGFLAAVGPSFVTVFLVYSILPASGTIDPLQVGLKVAALVPVGLAYYLTRNFGTAVLAGLAGYGLLLLISHSF